MSKQIQGLTLDEVKESLVGLLPDCVDFVHEHIIKPFCLTDEDYNKVYELMNENFDHGLDKATHDQATVKMWPSYVRDVPNGTETGKFLALDFGSHHLKIELVTLDNGKCEVDSKNGFVPDKILHQSDGATLFDYLAGFTHRFLKQRNLLNTPEPIPMGFTFAFPCIRKALNRAVLSRWTKSLHVDGVIGEEVVGMLEAAFSRKGEMNIDVDAVVNDTVGTLMSGALEDPKCAIGFILSKGTNACYIEKLENVGTWDGDLDEPKQVIIDTEWLEFGDDGCLDFIRSEYDIKIDDEHHKGCGVYEKLISGQYLGEIVRQVLQKLKDCDILFQDHWSEELSTPYRFYSKYVSEILSEEDIRFLHVRHALEDVHLTQMSELECRLIHHVCQLVSTRAATLVSIGVASLIDRVDRPEMGIAVDGALYRFHPLFHDLLMETIPKFIKKDKKFWLVPSADRSGKGAALAAAVTERLKRKDIPVAERPKEAESVEITETSPDGEKTDEPEKEKEEDIAKKAKKE